MNKKIVIITHKNCPDGFISAWVAWTIFKETATYIGEHPGQNTLSYINTLKNKDVYIFDISFPVEFIKQVESIANKLTIIDHHPDSSFLTKSKNSKFIFNKKYSAAYLCWQFFYPNEKIPLFIKLVSDNDTGTWKLKYSKELSKYIHHKLKPILELEHFQKASKLLKKKYLKRSIQIGKLYIDYETEIIKAVSRIATTKQWNNHSIMIANANIPKLGGTIANKFCEFPDIDIGIVYRYLSKDKVLYTMRSNNPKVDLNKIAGKYGGGGHAGAASFTSPPNELIG
jgi:uncharacterized protein